MNKDKKYYVYEHWRPDKNVCFYVGKGKGKRAYAIDRDNFYYQNIILKLAEAKLFVEIRFISAELSEELAFTIEKARIAYWRQLGVKLTNILDGGEGASGAIWNEQSRKLISAAAKLTSARQDIKMARSIALKDRWINDTDFIEKALNGLRGPRRGWKNNLTRVEQYRKRMKGNRNLLGYKFSNETRKRISKACRGRKLNLTKEERTRRSERIRNINLNRPAPNLGRTFTPEHCANISAARRRRSENESDKS